MKTDFSILVDIEDTEDARIATTAAKKKFPSAQITQLSGQPIADSLSERFYHIIISTTICTSGDDRKILLNAPFFTSGKTQIIPIIHPSNEQFIQTAIENNMSYYCFCPLVESELSFSLERISHRIHHTRASKTTDNHQKYIRFPGFIGESPAMQKLFYLIERIADDDFATVLIRGESGTGKELVARAIHFSSKRKKHHFVPVNCAAIPDDLLESELFGHIKGSFTGAHQSKQGRIQYADKGTLFLDEIGDMKPALQAKLLRVLQEKEFEPVGSLKPIPVDTRILAATHCNLEEQVKNGQFREDLYYRITVIPLEVPPLRKRIEDIPLLLQEFTNSYAAKRGRKKITFTPPSIQHLMDCKWRGNVRELENLVQHMSILFSGKNIHPHDLPEKYVQREETAAQNSQQPERSPARSPLLDNRRERAELLAPSPSSIPEIDLGNGPVDFNQLINDFEKELIIKAMKMTAGNKKEAARVLSLKRTTLLEKIKKKQLNNHW